MIVPAMQILRTTATCKLELQLPIYWMWIAALLGMAGADPLRGRRAVRAGVGSITGTRPHEPRQLIGAIGVAVLFALLMLRVPVWIALAAGRLLRQRVALSGWPASLALAGTVPFDVASSYTLSVVPLFILMGEVASESGLSGELFQRRARDPVRLPRRARGRDACRLRAASARSPARRLPTPPP